MCERPVSRHPLIVGNDFSRLAIHPTLELNDTILNVVSGRIVVEKYAFFGHGVALLTGIHDITKRGRERQHLGPTKGRDIIIGAGAWVASGATVIGPAVIGADAVVAAGALVLGDVPAATVVGGVPARHLRTLT